jgi:hypothetical protein
MKKHVNLVTLVMVAIAIASMFATTKGIHVPGPKTWGFSSGG